MAYQVLTGLKYPFFHLEGRAGLGCAHEVSGRGNRKTAQEAAGKVTQSPRRLVGGLDKCTAFAPKGRAANGVAASQPIQRSSEYNDTGLGLIYYNYRHYSPADGRWTGRDPYLESESKALYLHTMNSLIYHTDHLGLWSATWSGFGEARRIYLAEAGDTERELAEEVGLDVSEFRSWANPESTTKLKNGLYCKYSVPNTWIAADFMRGSKGGFFNRIYDHVVNLGGTIGVFVGTDLFTNTRKVVKVSDWSKLEEHLNKDAWGLVMFGLGNAQEEWIYSSSGVRIVTQTHIRDRIDLLGYKLSIVYLMQCCSAKNGNHQAWNDYTNSVYDYEGLNVFMFDI